MLIGVDFDNTLVCYDQLFHRLALEKGLIPRDLAAGKLEIRDYLRQHGQEEAWIVLQAQAYGARILEAFPFPGVIEFFSRCKKEGVGVCVISHKTRHPFRGERVDLHQAARAWLKQVGLEDHEIYFELTQEEKLRRIKELRCTHFIDDLEEFLLEPNFPPDVERIWFHSPEEPQRASPLRSVSSWGRIQEIFFNGPPAPHLPELREAAAKLLKEAGLCGPFELLPLVGGQNNRVLRVATERTSVLLKAYFQHPNDSRDRLGTEFRFCRFAWQRGLKFVPQPLGCDPKARIALYEFIEGRPVKPEEISEKWVKRIVKFTEELNRFREDPEAQDLPPASDACFSILDHLECVERRLRDLRSIEESSPINRNLLSFITGELSETWKSISEQATRGGLKLGLKLEAPLSAEDRRLSPSDFGFHNALIENGGRLRLIDLEYAGWDDPMKMVCDLFSLRSVAVPERFFDPVARRVASGLSNPSAHLGRAQLLWPVHQMKWCCLLLNDFLPAGSTRRQFASGEETFGRKERQLKKAQEALRLIRQNLPSQAPGSLNG